MSEPHRREPARNSPGARHGLRHQLRRAAGLFALGTLVIGAGCGDAGAPGKMGGATAPTRAAAPATPPLSVGAPLPTLRAEGWVNGPPVAPNAPGVRLLVVDAWGNWCPFCGRSAPGLVRAYEKYSNQGVAFVSLTSTGREGVEAYVRTHSVRWPSGYGVPMDTVTALGVSSGARPPGYEVAPTLYLIGPDGRVRWIDGRGRMLHQDPGEWERVVDAAIAEALAAHPTKP